MQSTPSFSSTQDSPARKRQERPRPRSHRSLAARLLSLALLSGCGTEPARSPPPGGPPRSVQLSRANRTRQPITTEVLGTVRAARSARIAALISGSVSEVRIGLGTAVRAGDVLVRVSARDVEARLAQAQAVYGLAQREGERAVALRAQDVISKAQYDAALSQLSVSEAKQREASTLAEHVVLRAPFDGVITVKQVNVGDTVLPGQTLLVLEARSALRFEAHVPEAAGRGLGIGATLPIRLEGWEGEVEGRIAEIEPGSDDATRTQLLRLDLPPLPELQPGRFGRLRLVTGEAHPVTVPEAALIRRGQLELVFVEDAGIARLRLVRTGRSHDGWQEIASGLSGGERVVVSRGDDLSDGQRVEQTE
jgi:membrane fusion protein (multidrug efflux system)